MDPLLQELELLRAKAAKRLLVSVCVGIGVGIVLLLILLPIFIPMGGSELIQVPFILSFFLGFGIGALMAYFWANPVKKEYVSRFKNEIVSHLLSKSFEVTDFQPEACFDSEEVKGGYIVPIGNKYRGDDLISGRYKGVDFRQSDLYIQHVVHSGKHTHTYTYFHGKYLILDFQKKEVEGYLQIREKESGAQKVSSFFSGMPPVEKVQMESIEFNKHYEVRATHPHSVFYLLTPHFMETVEHLCERVEGQIGLSFQNGKLHIAVHNSKNAYEPPLFSPIPENFETQVLEESKIITDIIDVLILDKKEQKNN